MKKRLIVLLALIVVSVAIAAATASAALKDPGGDGCHIRGDIHGYVISNCAG
jgi:hypothetical protein